MLRCARQAEPPAPREQPHSQRLAALKRASEEGCSNRAHDEMKRP
jgi:hypothetical protein